MWRGLTRIFSLAVLLVLASGVLVYYRHVTETDRKIQKLQDEKQQLQQVVNRLSSEKRVADILVTRQSPDAKGVIETTLLFVEYDKQGNALPGRSFTIEGAWAHIDAMVIKFDRGFVEANDPLRGHSIALFTKIYGDHQTPADAQMIDTPDKIPDVYRGADPRVSRFEMDLWKDFWKLYDDPAYREGKGVRALGGHGVWGPFKPDRLYTLTIESDGGLNMTSEPLKGIYKEALKDRVDGAGATTQPGT